MVERLKKVVKELPGCLVEASITEQVFDSVKIDNNKLSSINSGEAIKLEVRVTKGLRSAYAWTNNLNKWRDCVQRAKKLMRASSRLKKEPLVNSDNHSSKSFTHQSINKGVEFIKGKAKEAVKAANNLGVSVSDLTISKTLAKALFLNSNDVSYKHEQSIVNFDLETVSGNSSAWDSRTSQGLNLDFKGLAEQSARLCLDSLKAKKFQTGLFNVAFGYPALVELLSILTPGLSANNVLKHNSPLEGWINSEVLSPLISIRDVGVMPNGVHNQLMDAEGTIVKAKDLFSKGVLKGFLNDLYTASRLGVKPSGNSDGLTKRGLISNNYLVIEPGTAAKEELFDNCVYVNFLMGTHTANTVTGDFSLNALNSFHYKDGEKKPLRDLMISGNVFDLFKKAVMIGQESRFDGQVKSPVIKFKDVQVVG